MPLLLLALVACKPDGRSLDEAERWLRTGRFVDARARYIDLTASRDARVKVLAWVGAARASARLRDHNAARLYLERAAALPEVPGASEEAYFELAEHLRRDGEHARALNYYYRAAAGAEKHRARGWPYQQAITAIATMSTAP